jgi:hypothetical protein
MRYRLSSSSPSQRNSASSKPIASLVLKRGDPSRRREHDYDVLEDGKVVGRIFHLEAAAPEGRPWMWASGHGGHVERAAHGYAATRRGRWRRSPKLATGIGQRLRSLAWSSS